MNYLLERLNELRIMKLSMNRKKTKEVTEKFLKVVCLRDQENKGGKTKREQVFEELNTMIAYAKRLEFELIKCIDTPIKMFKILKQAKNGGKDLLNEDLKQEDYNKIVRYVNILTTNSSNLAEYYLL